MTDTTDAQLARERAQRPLAGWLAIAAGILVLAGGVGRLLIGRGAESSDDQFVDIFDALQARLVDNTATPAARNAVLQLTYIGEHLPAWLLVTALTAIGTLLFIVPLGLVFRAARLRNPEVRQVGGLALVVGVVASAIGFVVFSVGAGLDAQDFADLPAAQQTAQAAQNVGSDGNAAVGVLLEQLVGRFALSIGIVLVALNAMRVGLFTRFVGVLGIIVGVLVIFPLPVDQIGLLRSTWLVFVGLLLLGKMPRTPEPPAWERGEAVPWLTQQQVREARDAAPDQGLGNAGDPRDDDPLGGEPRRSRKRRNRG